MIKHPEYAQAFFEQPGKVRYVQRGYVEVQAMLSFRMTDFVSNDTILGAESSWFGRKYIRKGRYLYKTRLSRAIRVDVAIFVFFVF